MSKQMDNNRLRMMHVLADHIHSLSITRYLILRHGKMLYSFNSSQGRTDALRFVRATLRAFCVHALYEVLKNEGRNLVVVREGVGRGARLLQI